MRSGGRIFKKTGDFALGSAITEAVKKSAPECKNFIGVIVERENPASQSESNWDVRGVGLANQTEKGWQCVEYNP